MQNYNSSNNRLHTASLLFYGAKLSFGKVLSTMTTVLKDVIIHQRKLNFLFLLINNFATAFRDLQQFYIYTIGNFITFCNNMILSVKNNERQDVYDSNDLGPTPFY